MESLKSHLLNSQRHDIHIIADFIREHIRTDWENAFNDTQAKLVRLFAEIGDSAYGTYNQRLFKHIHEQFTLTGLKATPQLPGDLMISREWGTDECNRQRWMWSEITNTAGESIGTIVVVVFHDHEQIRIPHAFQILALEEIGKEEIENRLSSLSKDFKNAPDMRTEVALYMENNPTQDT